MSNPDSDLHLQFSITPILQHHDVVSPSAAANNPRKKRRSKVMRLENPKSSPSPRNGAVSAPKKPENRPEITMPCSECGKRFWSWKALFGHMRCHPERQWRGINPPPNLLRRRSDHLALMIGSSEEENDVAASLLLLSNGQPKTSEIAEARQEDVDHDQDQQTIHGHGGGVGGGSCRFECSSCKKVFGSRQALGGHRASHKKVKGCFAMARRIDAGGDGRQRDQNLVVLEAERNIFSMELGSPSSSLHKCGICLRIFSSGQALGGHMRCHWEKFGITSDDPPLMSQALNYSFSGLDLNLPAPVEDRDISSSSDLSASSSAMALDLRLGL